MLGRSSCRSVMTLSFISSVAVIVVKEGVDAIGLGGSKMVKFMDVLEVGVSGGLSVLWMIDSSLVTLMSSELSEEIVCL